MKKPPIQIRFGLVISACLISYFLVLSLFNLHTKPIFSLFNGLIVGFGIYEAINFFKHQQPDKFNYTNGFKIGLVTGFIASITFTIFFVFYATEIDPKFLNKLLTVFEGSYSVHVGLVTFVVGIMGISTTVVMTLTIMQWLKNPRNIIQNT
jgi:hypothetical protein